MKVGRRFFRMTREDVYLHLNTPFNPPDDSSTVDQFIEEYVAMRNKLVEKLSQIAQFDPYGGGDFYVGEDVGLSRGIGVDLISEKLVHQEFVPMIVQLLEESKADYEVCVAFDCFGHPAPILFINRVETKGDLTDALLQKLGF